MSAQFRCRPAQGCACGRRADGGASGSSVDKQGGARETERHQEQTTPGEAAVIPGAFDYHRPSSLDEAVALLVEHGDGGRLLAGGHSLISMMKLRLPKPPPPDALGGRQRPRGG